ncbi:MAG: hypothetical protein PHH60_01200 [Candidatus Margulisbacteria bacterium]|nr:hypothetical protein [Candidatus Margulisiibacteriota bacterium]
MGIAAVGQVFFSLWDDVFGDEGGSDQDEAVTLGGCNGTPAGGSRSSAPAATGTPIQLTVTDIDAIMGDLNVAWGDCSDRRTACCLSEIGDQPGGRNVTAFWNEAADQIINVVYLRSGSTEAVRTALAAVTDPTQRAAIISRLAAALSAGNETLFSQLSDSQRSTLNQSCQHDWPYWSAQPTYPSPISLEVNEARLMAIIRGATTPADQRTLPAGSYEGEYVAPGSVMDFSGSDDCNAAVCTPEDFTALPEVQRYQVLDPICDPLPYADICGLTDADGMQGDSMTVEILIGNTSLTSPLPSNLGVSFGEGGITVNNQGIRMTPEGNLTVPITIAATATVGLRTVEIYLEYPATEAGQPPYRFVIGSLVQGFNVQERVDAPPPPPPPVTECSDGIDNDHDGDIDLADDDCRNAQDTRERPAPPPPPTPPTPPPVTPQLPPCTVFPAAQQATRRANGECR